MIGAVAGVVAAALTWGTVYKKRGEAQVEEARRNADRIVEDARKSAQSRVKEADLEGKEKFLQLRSEFDRQSNLRREEMKNSERRLLQKEEALDKKTQQVESRTEEVEKRDRGLCDREKHLEARETQLLALIDEQRHRLRQN